MNSEEGEEISVMLEDCIQRESKLSAWEHDFIVSIKDQFEINKSLSPKQIAILNKVWDKVTS